MSDDSGTDLTAKERPVLGEVALGRTTPPGWLISGAMLVVLLAWASAFVGIRAVAPHLRPGPMALGRLLVAVPALALIAFGRRSARPVSLRPDRRTAAMVVLYGVAWFAAYNVVLNAAGHYIDAGTSAMLVNVGPLIVAVVAGFLLSEGYPPRLVVGVSVAFAGIAMIGFDGGLGGVGRDGFGLGIGLALLAACLYASGVLTQKVALRSIDPALATLAGAVVGAVVLSPYLSALVDDLTSAPRAAVAWLAFLGAVPTAIGFSLWSFVLRHASAGSTASATLAIPALTVVISWLLLDEIPTVQTMLGGLVAVTGVAISRR